MDRRLKRWAFSAVAVTVACLGGRLSPALAEATPTDEVIATVTAISRVPSPSTAIRTWRVTFRVEEGPGADHVPHELTLPFRSPALQILGVGRMYRLGIVQQGGEYVVDRSRIWEERTAKTPRGPRPLSDHYRVMRVLTRRPYLTWLAESDGRMKLFMSTMDDDPRQPRRASVLDEAETGILQKLPATDAGITFDKVDGLGPEFVLVKLSSRGTDAGAQSVERMQYLVHRPGQRNRVGDVACQFPGKALIRITRRDPLAFHVTAQAPGKGVGPASVEYEMIPPEITPSSPSCTIVPPGEDPSASDFEYDATLALADMLSGKNHMARAGQARQRAHHMRPNVENAEDIALLSITELNSFLDGGCSFAPTGPDPLPIPTHLLPLFRAYDDYLIRYPDARYVPYFIERKAAYLAQCQHHREAAQLYGTLVDKYPNHPLAEEARRNRADELRLAPE